MRDPKKNKMAGENLCFERTITSTWKDFPLQMLGSSVVEITSFVYTETISKEYNYHTVINFFLVLPLLA